MLRIMRALRSTDSKELLLRSSLAPLHLYLSPKAESSSRPSQRCPEVAVAPDMLRGMGHDVSSGSRLNGVSL
jgi:hypothetical protein